MGLRREKIKIGSNDRAKTHCRVMLTISLSNYRKTLPFRLTTSRSFPMTRLLPDLLSRLSLPPA